MHIIGTTGMGKSRFLEHMMRTDIDRGIGFCFLDPSLRGDTLKHILAYCAHKNFKKVLLIDPNDRWKYSRICPLNLFSKYKETSVAHAYDIIKVLFDMRNEAQFGYIQHYLPALLSVLWQAGATIYDSIYFTDYSNPFYREKRLEIFDRSARYSAQQGEPFDAQGVLIEGAFKNPTTFREFGSTVRRLDPLIRHDTLKLMFASMQGIKFTEIIKKGWVVLVNLHRGSHGITGMHTKLLATTVINEIISAMLAMGDHGWKGRYYLYLDEAGEYANDKVKDLLFYYRKSGLGVILAHQLNDQFGSPDIKNAVAGQTKIKVAFYQPSPKDRMDTVKSLYGGELKDRDVDFALKNLRKQHAVIMTESREPMFVRIPDVPDLPEAPKEFIQEIYSAPHYQSPDEVIHQIRNRFNDVRQETNNPPRTKRRKANDRQPTGEDSVRGFGETFSHLQEKYGD